MSKPPLVRTPRFCLAGRMVLLLLLLSAVAPKPGLAHSLSETVQLSNRYNPLLKTNLTMNVLNEISLTAIYTLSLDATYEGKEILTEYSSLSGLMMWATYGVFTGQTMMALGGGHHSLLTWDGGSWGMTASVGRDKFDDILRAIIDLGEEYTVSPQQWQFELNTFASWDYAWNASMGFKYFTLNINASKAMWEDYEEQVRNKSYRNLLLGNFLIYMASANIGYDWEWLGYTGLVLDMALNQDGSLVFSGQIIWEKEIFKPINLEVTGQYTSKKDLLVSLTVKCDF